MKPTKYTLLLLPLALLVSCSVKPLPINYGKDACVVCKMLISDNRFGAELVTPKGKVLTFDSDECMIRFLRQDSKPEAYRFILVADYANPGTLVEAGTAFYVCGEGIQSPMGGNIASFATEAAARQVQQQLGGDVVHWESAQSVIK